MNLYEFTFIAQQGLLQQDVEEIVQELGVLLKNIKADVISDEIKASVNKVRQDIVKQISLTLEIDNKIVQQELENNSEKMVEWLVVYFNALEKIVQNLSVDLKEDLSNLKEIKSKISKELKDVLGEVKGAYIVQKLSRQSEKCTKNEVISNLESTLKEAVLEYLAKSFENVLETLKAKYSKDQLMNIDKIIQSDKILDKLVEKLLKNIKVLGLIKYEHWGLLDFAYPINKMNSGHYCILCINSIPIIMGEFVRKVKLNENIIRYLSIRVDRFFEGKSYMMNKQFEEESR